VQGCCVPHPVLLVLGRHVRRLRHSRGRRQVLLAPLKAYLQSNNQPRVAGDSDRLIYGLDSYGFLCGTKNKIAGQEVDLTKRTNLYFLNPLELVDPRNYLYAKSVCVAKCPAPADRCDPKSIPCKKDNQYR
jgi:hypothetical protein